MSESNQQQPQFDVSRAETEALLYSDDEAVIPFAYPLLDEMAAKSGWNDPALDVYDDLIPREVFRTSLADWAEANAEHWGDLLSSEDVDGFTGRKH